jgi:hypothetical protein
MVLVDPELNASIYPVGVVLAGADHGADNDGRELASLCRDRHDHSGTTIAHIHFSTYDITGVDAHSQDPSGSGRELLWCICVDRFRTSTRVRYTGERYAGRLGRGRRQRRPAISLPCVRHAFTVRPDRVL